jgi:hypothetical protein
MNDAEALWRGKTDEEVADAARQLSDYTEEGERSSTVVNRDVDDTQLVVVGTFSNTIEAELAQGALQAADIASLVSADDAGGLRPSLWLSGVRLLVRAEDARQAQEILGSSK